MTGRVRLIVQDILNGDPLDGIKKKHSVTLVNIRAIAKRYNILLKQDKLSSHRSKSDKPFCSQIALIGDNDSSEPIRHFQAIRHSSLGRLDRRWQFIENYRTSSEKSNRILQNLYGL